MSQDLTAYVRPAAPVEAVNLSQQQEWDELERLVRTGEIPGVDEVVIAHRRARRRARAVKRGGPLLEPTVTDTARHTCWPAGAAYCAMCTPWYVRAGRRLLGVVRRAES
jgi:hypothetical protein